MKIKKIIVLITIVGVIAIASAAFVAAQSPAEIVSGLTGKTVDELYAEKAEGETFASIADDAGKLEEFKEQMLAQKKAILDQRVEDGELSQEEADEIYNRIKDRMANCDGLGNGRNGENSGVCSGQGKGKGKGKGNGNGQGGRNRNNGGMRNGPCING